MVLNFGMTNLMRLMRVELYLECISPRLVCSETETERKKPYGID